MDLDSTFKDVTETVSHQAGDVIFEQGQPGDCMYLVKEGEVAIQVGGTSVSTVSPGEIFGELALVSNEPRSASAVAATDCCLLPVDEERFLFLVQQTPYFSLHVMGILGERLRQQNGECC